MEENNMINIIDEMNNYSQQSISFIQNQVWNKFPDYRFSTKEVIKISKMASQISLFIGDLLVRQQVKELTESMDDFIKELECEK